MRKFITKIAVIAASVAIVASMSAASFAANPSLENTITIDKNLEVVNSAITSVDGPGVTFNYAVAPVAPSASNGGTSITDGSHHESVVTQGPSDGVTLSPSSISFPKGTALTASSAGAVNAGTSITATADVTKFSYPGIYRYEVSETTTPETLPAGVTNTANQKRYIDVYVKKGTNGLEISGLVLHDGTASNGAPAQKASFSNARYETKNVAVKKEVAGSMADPRAAFYFTATVSNNGRTFYTGSTASGASNAVTGTSATATLGNGQELWLCGLSTDATVGFSEDNTFGGNTYTATYKVGNGSSQDGASMAAANLANGVIVTFTNTLDDVSPTGVMLRFGPYIGMVLAAAVLFAMLKRASKRA